MKRQSMSFVFEKVGNNKELWTNIGFRDPELKVIPYSKYHLWCADITHDSYLFQVGSLRADAPRYFDLSYKMRIIRIAVAEIIETRETGAGYIYRVQRITIPRSVWEERSEIIKIIEESVNTSVHAVNTVASVKMNCEPECVEMDYNGR